MKVLKEFSQRVSYTSKFQQLQYSVYLLLTIRSVMITQYKSFIKIVAIVLVQFIVFSWFVVCKRYRKVATLGQ